MYHHPGWPAGALVSHTFPGRIQCPGAAKHNLKHTHKHSKIHLLLDLEKLYILFNKNASKVTVKTFIMLQKIILNFLFICESWKIKCVTVSTKTLTVFNIDNNQKCFLSSKSAYYYDFWRITEECSNDAENTALITEINYSLTHIHIENSCL